VRGQQNKLHVQVEISEHGSASCHGRRQAPAEPTIVHRTAWIDGSEKLRGHQHFFRGKVRSTVLLKAVKPSNAHVSMLGFPRVEDRVSFVFPGFPGSWQDAMQEPALGKTPCESEQREERVRFVRVFYSVHDTA